MASDMMVQLAEAIRAGRTLPRSPEVAAQRAQMEKMQGALPVPPDVVREDLTIAGIRCRWLACPESRADRVVLYLHGGGYVMGSLDTHTELMARLARAARCRVLGVEYRLAPEHPFPAALDDALAVYRSLAGDPALRIAIAGDSAGGGLGAAVLLALRAAGERLPRAAVLFSPWTDLTGTSDTYRTRAEQDPMIDPQQIRGMAAHYIGADRADNPAISPLFGDLTGLPPLLVQVGDHEVLLDDSVEFVRRAREQRTDAELEVWEGAFHVFQAMPQLPEAAEALASAARFLELHWELHWNR